MPKNNYLLEKGIFWVFNKMNTWDARSRCEMRDTEKQKVAIASFQIGFLFYSDALKITWFSLVSWRASLKGKWLRKLINIRGFVIKTSFFCSQTRSPQSSYPQIFSLNSGLQININVQVNIYWLMKDLFFYEDMYILSDLFSSSFFLRWCSCQKLFLNSLFFLCLLLLNSWHATVEYIFQIMSTAQSVV